MTLLQADADQGRLGVAAVLQAVAEACAQRHDVLQGPAELDASSEVKTKELK